MKKLTPIRAIRARCIDCCAGQKKEVALCTDPKCPLYPYRLGRRPKEDYFIDDNYEIFKSGDSSQFSD